jgi:hypothetical protein
MFGFPLKMYLRIIIFSGFYTECNMMYIYIILHVEELKCDCNEIMQYIYCIISLLSLSHSYYV